MYNIDDLIVYGKMGVFKITDIKTQDNISLDHNQLYYILQPMNGNCVVYTPTNTKAFMRPIISAEEAEHLIDEIPDIQVDAYFNDNTNGLTQHYEEIFKENTCADLIKLSISLYAKKQISEKNKHKFGQTDERFMKKAEELLCEEFSVALNIPKEKVLKHITSNMSEKTNKPHTEM